MAFVARLPTFNQSITIFRLDALGVWTPDAAPVLCQVYFPRRNFQIAWVADFYTSRGISGSYDYQASQYSLFVMLPKTATPRDPIDVGLAIGAPNARDYFEWTWAPLGTRTYWIDQVEPRWPGFPNEHLVMIATRRIS